jgi:hypothetical protein
MGTLCGNALLVVEARLELSPSCSPVVLWVREEVLS